MLTSNISGWDPEAPGETFVEKLPLGLALRPLRAIGVLHFSWWPRTHEDGVAFCRITFTVMRSLKRSRNKQPVLSGITVIASIHRIYVSDTLAQACDKP